MEHVDWVNKGLGISNRVCASGHIKDPAPLIKKGRALCPGRRFPPSFIHSRLIMTGLKMALDADRVETPTQTRKTRTLDLRLIVSTMCGPLNIPSIF